MIQNQRFNTRLKPLTLEGAMQLMLWRNDPAVLSWMEYQQVITEEEQREWYESLSTLDCYYEIWHSEAYIGVIHLRENKEEGLYESGVLIGEEHYRKTGVVFEASLLLLHWACENHRLPIQIKVNKAHQNALEYNAFLGFEVVKERGDFVFMELNSVVFKEKFHSYF